MKFKCKEAETWPEYEKRIKKWHKWFAWYPVSVGKEDCRWLETVERSIKIEFWYDGIDKVNTYKPLGTHIKE